MTPKIEKKKKEGGREEREGEKKGRNGGKERGRGRGKRKTHPPFALADLAPIPPH